MVDANLRLINLTRTVGQSSFDFSSFLNIQTMMHFHIARVFVSALTLFYNVLSATLTQPICELIRNADFESAAFGVNISKLHTN